MITIKNHKQLEIFDPWAHLSPKRRQMLEQGWPGLLQKEILGELPVEKLMPFFCSNNGRPSKELSAVLGVLVLQQTMDLTDEEAVQSLAFDIRWHYAMNITEESDFAKYMCPKTLWHMRSIVAENHLESEFFKTATGKLLKRFAVDTDKQRLDSVHIRSNMKRLGRITIFVTAINKFIKNLKRQYKSLFESLDPDLVERYLPEKALKCFGAIKPSESGKTLKTVSQDLFNLVRGFKDNADVTGMHSYKLLDRIIDEHCNLTASEEGTRIDIKPPKEIPSDSLQNPSDPDATYSGHKGQGYQVQIMETYSDAEENKKEKDLRLITHVKVEQAHESDAHALIPAIKDTRERDVSPREVLVDAAYGGDDNVRKAEKESVEVVAPAMGDAQNNDKLHLSDFELSDKGTITACPIGHAPIETKKKKRFVAAFDLMHCKGCPNEAVCPAKRGKKRYYLRYGAKEMRLAKRRAYEQTEAFVDRYRWRAGVEATMSEFDRRTGVKQLRVRGLKAVRYSATMKALGLNILRAAAAWAMEKAGKDASTQSKRGLILLFMIVKELFGSFFQKVIRIFIGPRPIMGI